jgi:hypothetical protein
MHVTIEVMLETRCLLCLCNGVIRRTIEDVTRVEAGSNTSTVTLRVLGGDEK